MNGSAVHVLGERVAERAAVVPVIYRNADLDQPVGGERAVHFGDELRCDSRVAHPHDRFQRMRARLQAGALLRRRRCRHVLIVAARKNLPTETPMRRS
jgi:hypothetical protein